MRLLVARPTLAELQEQQMVHPQEARVKKCPSHPVVAYRVEANHQS
jgi:hypothetical protein